MTCGPGSPGTPQLPWSARSLHCGPVPATSPAMPPASRCASWDGAQCSPGGQPGRLDELIAPLVSEHAPSLLALYGIGPHTAALLLIAAGDPPRPPRPRRLTPTPRRPPPPRVGCRTRCPATDPPAPPAPPLPCWA